MTHQPLTPDQQKILDLTNQFIDHFSTRLAYLPASYIPGVRIGLALAAVICEEYPIQPFPATFAASMIQKIDGTCSARLSPADALATRDILAAAMAAANAAPSGNA